MCTALDIIYLNEKFKQQTKLATRSPPRIPSQTRLSVRWYSLAAPTTVRRQRQRWGRHMPPPSRTCRLAVRVRSAVETSRSLAAPARCAALRRGCWLRAIDCGGVGRRQWRGRRQRRGAPRGQPTPPAHRARDVARRQAAGRSPAAPRRRATQKDRQSHRNERTPGPGCH